MKRLIVFSLVCLIAVARGAVGEDASLAKELEPLRPFLGCTWKGHFADSTAEKPNVDVTRMERALNGQAVRSVHSVNDGAYGGESFIMWNPKTEKLEFHYFTTAGFRTEGTLKVEGRKIVTVEEVVGNSGGISEVQATMELLEDGKLRVKSRYLKNGEWVDGRDMTYERAEGAEIKFR